MVSASPCRDSGSRIGAKSQLGAVRQPLKEIVNQTSRVVRKLETH